ncbi:AAA family ATPase [uncultured Anaerococcus sp.]|uniref:ATP-binding protein n=1 Tax=uncultured Anaerococcus sp. TaxID=293428 RepID=UPI00280B6727|nr:AAA family ATPase [uncultured Anaerococcus sp.]
MTRIFIEELNIKSFGKFQNEIIKLEPSFNLIYGLNETGKTTIKNFIEGMFYGFDEGKLRISFSNKREIYRPKSSYIYAGEMKIRKNDKLYLLYRNFDNGDFRITNLSCNKELDIKKSDLNAPGKFFLGIDYDIYKSYISSEQIQEISSDSKKKILEKLSSSDVDYNFSVKNALEILDNRLRELGTDRAYTKPYYKTKEKIENLDVEIAEIDRLKRDFYKSFKKLEEEKSILSDSEIEYKTKKETNQIYQQKRSDENFKSYRQWSDKLFELDKELEAYADLEGLDKENLTLEESKDIKKDYRLIYTFAILGLALLVIFSKNPYILLLSLPFIYLILRPLNEDGGNNQAEYNSLRRRFEKYENLLSEREKILDVLDILKKQDLSLIVDDKAKNLDFTDYDNIKELKEISKLESEIRDRRLKIHSQEKELLSVDNILQKEAGLRDDLKYQRDILEKIEKEIEAIKLAKKIILEIAGENRADIDKLNRKIKTILNEASKSQFVVSFDKDLQSQIRDKSSFVYNEDQLSKGFFDQVNLAMKLSLVEEVVKDCFLIFDDAFINFDIERLIRFLYLILDESSERQIIYFTCHKREEDFFEAENIDVNRIQLEDR